MFDPDLEPRHAKKPKKNLDPLSLDELNDYIQEMKDEIVRAEAEIARKKAHIAAASSFFKTNT